MAEGQYYTKEALEKLKIELNELKKKKRREVAERIRDAKSFGDLSENAEYSDAKEAQAFVEGRIDELEHTLENAKVVKEGETNGKVQVGRKVLVVDDKGQEKEYFLVSANEVNSLESKISTSSPIGQALLGKKAGDQIEADIPAGKMKLTIKKVE
ncbi:transcription elongation factor GreA [Patescibacteria group bacterium]